VLNSNRTADPFETWHKIDYHSKLCSLLLKFSKWQPFQNGHQYKKFQKSLKIQKWTDFNGNGYLQGIRHAAPYGTILVFYGGHFEAKMATKI
jgi:hypothetical protein